MIIIRIATFNIRNKNLISNISDSDYYEKLDDFIRDNKIDILGLQELIPRIKKLLDSTYNLFGKSRFIFPFKYSKYNEYNSILTNYKVISTKTHLLPFIGSKIPRIATVSNINIDNVVVRVINTHLCLYKYHDIKLKELDKLIEIIKETEIPTIIMGDFNLRNDCMELDYFTDELKKLGIKKVNNKDNTYGKNILDYIFVSNAFKIKRVNVVTTDFSDHKAIVVDLKL